MSSKHGPAAERFVDSILGPNDARREEKIRELTQTMEEAAPTPPPDAEPEEEPKEKDENGKGTDDEDEDAKSTSRVTHGAPGFKKKK